MSLDGEELRSGALPWRDEEDAWLFDSGAGEGGVTADQAGRIADDIMAATPGETYDRLRNARRHRNRHLDGFGGRHNA